MPAARAPLTHSATLRRLLYEALASLGLEPARIYRQALRRVRLAPVSADGRLLHDEVPLFWAALPELSGDADIGLHLGEAMKPRLLDVVGYLLLASRDLEQALHSFLRQDPDIMMIGEIRNLETAQIAVQAALTGHLVLSTVHTNDAGSAMTRLLDMGIENYLLNSTVNAVLGQRLVRRLCDKCREPYEPPAELASTLDLRAAGHDGPLTLYRPTGCPACNNLGFAGRTIILELMVMNDAIRSLVLRRAEAREIQTEAIHSGMQTMYVHGMRKALAGITTIEEVFRVTRDM